MPVAAPRSEQNQFVRTITGKTSAWKLVFRFIRWTTYGCALSTLILLLHKASPPPVETSPQAAARVEEKLEAVERAVARGQAATLRLDETELNSYLSSHLDPGGALRSPPAVMPQGAPTRTSPSPQDVGQVRSNVSDVKVQLVEDRVKAYVVFNVHGKDMTLRLEGRLGAQNGYLRFEPVSGQIGSLPIPQSTLESAVQRLMDSPQNREKLKLPSEISDLRIQNGEVVASYN